ncbi:MAG TPA: hypothetical protein VFV67_13380 [Actinophytocola sp.]|uniref:hypothetical protein n=1 Tax=Actinophytocola sp. TaxID=1872138 RepID=UPI002DBEB3CF|nr:hypothetical protein [Actinophytocola sp.]HEU5471640.1 hypothetical protein [Actinophytocola sp.]
MTNAFTEVFVAGAPRPELAEHLAPFAPLIGSWDLRVFEYEPDGVVRESSAEWHFSWALDGRAVADVWINPARADRGPDADGEWGLSLRFYDPAIGAWRSTWHGPKRGWVIPFVARTSADGIVLEGRQGDTGHRWIFSELTGDSFRWRREETGPDGNTAVRQRFEAKRVG